MKETSQKTDCQIRTRAIVFASLLFAIILATWNTHVNIPSRNTRSKSLRWKKTSQVPYPHSDSMSQTMNETLASAFDDQITNSIAKKFTTVPPATNPVDQNVVSTSDGQMTNSSGKKSIAVPPPSDLVDQKVASTPDGEVANSSTTFTVVNPDDVPSRLQIKILRNEDIVTRGPGLHSFHLWSQYLHAQIYSEGVPREDGAVNFAEMDGTKIAYDGYIYKPPNVSRWDKNISHWERSNRFPSVEERIRFYMGRWYDIEPNPNLFGEGFPSKTQHCINITDKNALVGKIFLSLKDSPFEKLYTPEYLFNFTEGLLTPEPPPGNKALYARDMIDLAILHFNSTTTAVVHIGDGATKLSKELNYSYPVFAKVRDIIAEKDTKNHWRLEKAPNCIQCGGKLSSILWPLNRARHFKPSSLVPLNDIPWKKKIGKLVWRGRAYRKESTLENALPIELSAWKQRSALVKDNLNSKLVDAKFTGAKSVAPDKYMGQSLDMEKMLKFKYLIAIEGNDVSSGLKWMLFSNSLLFMPPVTFTSWAMEPLLEPFVHYIPVHANMSNVEEMVRWANKHPTKAKHIAERGTLFAYDLLFHPDSYRDEELILSGIMKKYEEKFGSHT